MRGLARLVSWLVASFALLLLIALASPAAAQPTVRVNGVAAPAGVSVPVGSTVFVGVSSGKEKERVFTEVVQNSRR